MRILLALYCLIWCVSLLNAQEKFPFITWEEAKYASPDTVHYITFSKSKWKVLPDSLSRYHRLKALDLSKNQLTELPNFIGTFDSLIYLDLSKNELGIFPIQICRLTHLKMLILNRNEFEELPECIQYLSALEYLDLWSTPIRTFPVGFTELKNLKTLDLQGNRYSPTFQKQLKAKLQGVQILLDPPCDCME
jgi:Leucine-rich repeat (LRR) protein